MPRRELKVGMSSAGGQKRIVIGERDWERIETGYGQSIRGDLRDRIQEATQRFALSAIFEVRAARLVDARKATNEVLSAGQALRNALKDEPAEMNGRFYAFHLIRNYLRDERLGDYTAFPGPIAALRSVLNSFVTACEQSLAELHDPNRAEFVEGAAWDAWVRQLLCILSEAGLPTAARKDTDKQKTSIPSSFVALVRELQRCVPRACYLQRSDAALATAISAARRRAGE